MNSYRALFIFPKALDEENLRQACDKAAEEIKKLGGRVDEVQVLGSRVFARPLKKQEAGQYVRMCLALAPARVNGLLARYKLSEDVFRVQIVRAQEAPREAAAAPEADRASTQEKPAAGEAG